jgi:threonine/homoserine/homoserine lactone efflux protein
VLATLLFILPFGFVGSLSPMMFTEQTLILTTKHGRRDATAYAIGAIFTLLIFTSVLVIFGRAIQLPDNTSLSAGLDLLIGVVMLLAAVLIHRSPDQLTSRSKGRKVPPDLGILGGLGFGVFSMVTNFKALALMVPAAKAIATTGGLLPERIILTVVLVLITSIPAWLPVILTVVAPDLAGRAISAIKRFLDKHGRFLLLLILVVLGVLLVVRGIVELSSG